MGLIKGRFSLLLFLQLLIMAKNLNTGATLLNDLIESATKIATYFEKDSHKANVDGIFGIHLSQEQLAAFLEKIIHDCLPEERKNLNKVIDKLKKLQTRLKAIIEIEIPRIKINYTSYFEKVAFGFEKNIWKFLATFQNINNTLLFPENLLQNNSFKEDLSDTCLGEWKKQQCDISSLCWEYATEKYQTGYYITHQLLYFIFGKASKCEIQINDMAKKYDKNGLSSDIFKMFCTNIFRECKQLAKHNISILYWDLFMEQIGLCGVVGYHEFFKSKWIQQIIHLQHPSGCFKSSDQDIPYLRQKREELEMSDGCLSHMTTVALIAIQQSIRYFLEPYLQNNCQNWMSTKVTTKLC